MGREMRTHLAASSNILGHRVPVLFHMHQSGTRDEKWIVVASTPLDRGHAFLIPGVNIAKLSQNGPISEFKWTPIWTEGYFWKRTSTNHQGKLSQNGPNKCSEATSRREGSWIKGVEITTQGVQNRNEIVANSTWSSSSREGCSKTASRSDNGGIGAVEQWNEANFCATTNC